MTSPAPLAGKIALVAGSTRGAGRAIAITLAAAGARVYATGRSVGAPARAGRPETTDETAVLARARGGDAIAVRVDHTDPAQVAGLVARIEAEAGRLDVLVNNVNGDELTDWSHPLWVSDLGDGLRMLERGVHSHVITSHAALPLMVRTGAGLVAGINDLGVPSFFYGLVKRSVAQVAALLDRELRDRGVTAVAVAPGFLRSEAMLEHFGVTEATWQSAIGKDEFFAESETPYYLARAIAALAADPRAHRLGGQQLTSWGLAEHYGLCDVDGRTPHWDRFFAAKLDQRWDALVPALAAEAAARGLPADLARVSRADATEADLLAPPAEAARRLLDRRARG